MPARNPKVSKAKETLLRKLGQKLRDRRKELGLGSVVTAEAAGMSRVTLYRIEQGEASVTMGAYLSALVALGLEFDVTRLKDKKSLQKSRPQKIPDKIRVSDYKQLKKLAWQIKQTKELSPKDVLEIYERNWKHVDLKMMDAREKNLLETLLAAFGRERLLV